MKKKFVIRKIMIGRESLYLYKGEYGNTFGHGITKFMKLNNLIPKKKLKVLFLN